MQYNGDWGRVCAEVNESSPKIQMKAEDQFLRFFNSHIFGQSIGKVPLRHYANQKKRDAASAPEKHTWEVEEPTETPTGQLGEIVRKLQNAVQSLPPCQMQVAGRKISEGVNGDIGRHMETSLRVYHKEGQLCIGESEAQARLCISLIANSQPAEAKRARFDTKDVVSESASTTIASGQAACDSSDSSSGSSSDIDSSDSDNSDEGGNQDS